MILLIDVGGTKTRIALSEREGDIAHPVLFPTEKEFDAGINKIAEETQKIIGSSSLEAVVMGTTGQVSKEGVILKSPNLANWQDRDVKNVLSERFNTKAFVLNDAVMGALGEAHYGAGKDAKVLLYMTIGTGIGAARVIDGKPDLTVGSETGHQYVTIEKVPIEAEDIISGRAIRAAFGKGGEEVRDQAMWDHYSMLFALPLYNTILHFIPDTVVIGGSLVKEGSMSVEKIKEHLHAIARLPRVPEVLPAKLGDLVGLYGAHAYARSMLS